MNFETATLDELAQYYYRKPFARLCAINRQMIRSIWEKYHGKADSDENAHA